MSNEKIAIVTGANKGIGYAIVKGLCQKFDGVVYLTSRDEERGLKAVADLKKKFCNPVYHQLDVADEESVKRFGDFIKKKHTGIDILINNAGVSSIFENTYESKKSIIDINYKGLLNVEKYLFPLLKGKSRVVNVSSDCGHLSNVKNKEWLDRLSKTDLTRSDIEDFIDWYLDSEKKGTFNSNDLADGGSFAAYRVSKVSMCALTMLQQKDLEAKDISVNSMHPGLVSTDMTMRIGFLSPDEAAITPLYLVLDAPQSLKGKYIWYDKTEIDWYDYKTPYYFKASSVGTTAIKNVLMYPVKLVASSELWIGVFSIGLVLILTMFNDDIIKATGF